jgi:transcriptional regulator with XRE-family HTH domain
MNTKAEIQKLQSEIARLRKLGRTKRKPIQGIGGAIQCQREGDGVGLRELATRAKVSAGLLSRIEQTPNANPRFHTVEKLARALGVKTSLLVAMHEDRKQKTPKP